MIKYKYVKPSIKQFVSLRNAAGWNLKNKKISKDRAINSLRKSPLCVCAFDKNKIIGMIRICGDLDMYGYIQDSIVLPEYQHIGVGTRMMNMLLNKVKRKKGYLLGVCPSKVAVDFYQKFGFKKRPENPNGFMSLEF